MTDRADRLCAICGRTISWRRKWAKVWDEIRYCSQQCRRQRNDPQAADLEAMTLQLLARRAPSHSCCPSEVARRFAAEAGVPDDWRGYMEPVRRAARRLAQRKRIVVTQRGRPIDPSTMRGPIRLARGARFELESS